MRKAHYNPEEFSRSRGCLTYKRTSEAAARRKNPEPERTDGLSPFVVDELRIITSPPFIREQNKTQVLPALMTLGNPLTRVTHSVCVSSIAAMTARHLGLNEDLCRAIGFGHDLGHMPFGHVCEDFLSDHLGFKVQHGVVGVVLMQLVENDGSGYNLTYQVLEGMEKHSRRDGPLFENASTFEATLGMFQDKIGYTFYDAANFSHAKVTQLPASLRTEMRQQADWFGQTVEEQFSTCMAALSIESAGKERVSFEDSEVARHFKKMKDFMYREVYYALNRKNDIDPMLKRVYEKFGMTVPGVDPLILIALMTDLAVERLAQTKDDAEFTAMMHQMPVADYIPILRKRAVNLSDPGLNW